ncbi:MAG: molybdopterin-dependent oxidoreductase, partial [Dehalococcoidia bacterium]|nr:molybdopterin-dependent oxidoreductase [Dehalococcoidia bacterium]
MPGDIEIKKSVCVWCKGECGVLIGVKDQHMVNAVEDPAWPRKVWPATRACVRLKAAKDWFYHPLRVDYPLKRAGGKGEGKWQTITWDQALDEIADKIGDIKKKYGAEAIGSTVGTGYRTDEAPRSRFLQLLGTPTNPGQSTICFGSRSVMANTIVGMFHNFAIRPTTKCIVLLGVEPLISRPIIAKIILEAKKNGCKFITFDPRETRSAKMSDIWFQLRPGTDCAILLGMINVIISEKLYDKDFVDKYCYGFDKIRERAAKYTPQLVESISRVPAEKVIDAARMYATNKPGSFIEGMGIEHLQNNSEILHARWILAGITGNIDVPGGEELFGPHPKIKSRGELEGA